MRVYHAKMCDICGVRSATCHTVVEIGGRRCEADLCDVCLERQMINKQPVYQAFMSPELECPVCHTRLSDVAGNEYLGCSECYNVFRKEVLNNIQSMHGTRKHLGKRLRTGKQTKNVDLSDRESMKEQYYLARDEGRADDTEELYGYLRGEDGNE